MEERVQRRLAAILAADVAGYSRLMQDDEEATHVRFSALLKDTIEPAIAELPPRNLMSGMVARK